MALITVSLVTYIERGLFVSPSLHDTKSYAGNEYEVAGVAVIIEGNVQVGSWVISIVPPVVCCRVTVPYTPSSTK